MLTQIKSKRLTSKSFCLFKTENYNYYTGMLVLLLQ